jgi:hypothetical protein
LEEEEELNRLEAEELEETNRNAHNEKLLNISDEELLQAEELNIESEFEKAGSDIVKEAEEVRDLIAEESVTADPADVVESDIADTKMVDIDVAADIEVASEVEMAENEIIAESEGVETTDSIMINGEVKSDVAADSQEVEINNITESEEVGDLVAEKGISYTYIYVCMNICIYVYVYRICIYIYIYTNLYIYIDI